MTDIESKITTSQVKRLYSTLHQTNLNQDEFSELARQEPAKFTAALDPSCPWSHWYDISYPRLLLLFLTITGQIEVFVKINPNGDPIEQVLDHIESGSGLPNEESLSDEEKALIASLFIVMDYQRAALSIFNQTLSALVQRVKDGDDEALFDAILVDRTVTATPSIAKRIQLAQITNDEPFFLKLSKAITRTRPRRPVKEYDDLRFMVAALDECKAFSARTTEEFYDLLVDELELYPTDKGDSFKGFEKLLERIRKSVNDT